jgi:hypothetical protein
MAFLAGGRRRAAMLLLATAVLDMVEISRSDVLASGVLGLNPHSSRHTPFAFSPPCVPGLRRAFSTSFAPSATCSRRGVGRGLSSGFQPLAAPKPALLPAQQALRQQQHAGVACRMSGWRRGRSFSDDPYGDEGEEGVEMMAEDDMDEYRLVLLRDSKVFLGLNHCPDHARLFSRRHAGTVAHIRQLGGNKRPLSPAW